MKGQSHSSNGYVQKKEAVSEMLQCSAVHLSDDSPQHSGQPIAAFPLESVHSSRILAKLGETHQQTAAPNEQPVLAAEGWTAGADSGVLAQVA